ncbi:MAG: pyridoxal-phosphate dependent enzyme, partial [Nitrososphaeraceae archaeon]|nr:pyridoxal-phosphate dependent enzyme [Nitrososphaeraceae archaeon]
YPMIVRDFQSVIGEEIKSQLKNLTTTASTSFPHALVCCVGGGSNAMGTFFPFLDHNKVSLFGVEAGGMGIKTGKHSATLKVGSEGILHGMRTYLLQDEFGQINDTHSISAGLDYPGVGPQHVQLKDIERAEYVTCSDKEALDAFFKLSRLEGIIAALESCHAVSYAMKLAKKMRRDQNIIVTLSGRGDKDIDQVMKFRKKFLGRS